MKVVIAGGGISGLSAAYYLSKAGIRATLIDKSPQLGGVIRSSIQHGCLLEDGPDSFLAQKPWLTELIGELGMADQLIGSNDSLRVTYILKHGKLVALPDGLVMMAPTKVMPLLGTSLLGWGTKIRMGLELLRRPAPARPDRSVEEFLLDHYGQETIDYLGEPLLAGVYGGDPKQMSANSVLPRFVALESKYGSLSRGVLAEARPAGSGSLFRSLKNGLGQLADALRPHANILCGTVDAIERTGAGFRIRANGDWMDADRVLLAMPASDGASLVRPLQAEAGDLLANIPYTSSVTVSLVYRKDSFPLPLKGFGFLVPKKERKYVAACTWVNNKFNYRVPDDMILLRCFLGGNAFDESDAAIAQLAQDDLQRIMGLHASPLFYRVAKWRNSMAQYTVGHEKRIERLESIVKTIPGLHLAGNAYHGIGLPDCVRLGKQAASQIATS